jgi:hypothetical protein
MAGNGASAGIQTPDSGSTEYRRDAIRKWTELVLVSEASQAAYQGEYASAEALLADLTRDPSASIQTLDLLARIRAQQGFLSDAETLWKLVLQRDPANVAAKAALARMKRRSLRWPTHRTSVLMLGVLLGCLVGAAAVQVLQTAGRPQIEGKKGPSAFVEQPPAPEVRQRTREETQPTPGLGPVSGLAFSRESNGYSVRFSFPVFHHATYMTSEGGKQVRRLGRELSRHAEAIEAIVVTGCTDAAVPFADSNYSNNYELSLARAVVIVVELNRESRLPRDVFTAKGSDVNSLACTGGPDLKLPAARTVSLRIVFKK